MQYLYTVMRFLFIFILSSLLCFPLTSTAADEPHYFFSQVHLGVESSNPYITSLYKDKTGTVWSGNREGVDKLSASGHKNYKIRDAVMSIVEDSSGEIWLSTSNDIFRYNRYSDVFDHINTAAKGLCVAYGNELWAYNYNTLWRIDCTSLDGISETVFPRNIEISSIDFLSDGTPLLGTRDAGIWKYNPNNGEISRFSDVDPHFTLSMKVNDDIVYAGTYGNGVFIFDSSGTYKGKISSLPSEYITSFAVFDNHLWVSTDGAGIASYDPESGCVQSFRHVPGDNTTLPSDAIKIILGDDTGKELWIGTVRYGLYNAHSNFIRTFGESPLGSTYGLSERCSFGHFLDDDGKLWVGTDGQGLNSYDTETGTFRHFPSTFGKFMPSVSGYRGDELLVDNYTKGLVLFNKKTGAVRNFGIDFKEDDDRVYFPFRINDRQTMIFCHYCWTVDIPAGKYELMLKEDGSPATELFLGWYCKDFALVFSGNTVYVNYLDDNVFHYLCNVSSCGNIGCLSFDRIQQRLWVGLGTPFFSTQGYAPATDDVKQQEGHFGYFSFNPDKRAVSGDFVRMPYSPFSNARSMTSDQKGRVWIASGSRLYLYQPDQDSFRIFGPLDGYSLNDALYGHYTEVTNGHIYFSGPSGLADINTSIADETFPDRTITMSLSEIITDYNRYVFKPSDPKTVSIPKNHGKVRLNFSITGGRFNDINVYSYIVSGQEESRSTSTSASLDLMTLSPGTYVVRAGCESGTSISQSSFETVKITVRQPWYSSIYFTVFLILLFLGLVSIGIFFYVKKNLVHSGIVKNARSETDDEFLAKFKAVVYENIKGEITTEFLMMSLGMSRTPLFEKVKRLTGYSLHDCIKRLRITRAVTLLKTTEMTVNEISVATGFAYPRYFSSVFKELTGSTPTQFRKELTSDKKDEPCSEDLPFC